MTDSLLGQGGFMLNRDPETLGLLDFPDDVWLVDSTIRSLQSSVSGSRHSVADLVEIGHAVDGLGVREILVNTLWGDGVDTIAGLAHDGTNAKIVATYRVRHPLKNELLTASAASGAGEICFESPVDVQSLQDDLAVVQEAGLSFSTAFAEKHSWEEMLDLARVSIQHGAKSLSFHDSFFRFGVTPQAMHVFIRRLRRLLPGHPPLYIHLSNFYGTAAMTAVAGLAAGANAVDVCLNGTGHHCGHISLGEVALILEDLYDQRTGINLADINDAVRRTTELTGVPIKLQQPVIGEMAFMIDGADWAAEAHMPYDDRMHSRLPVEPDVVGAHEQMIWTTRTATAAAVCTKLSDLALPEDEDTVRRVRNLLDGALELRDTYPAYLLDAEYTRLIRTALRGNV